MTEQNTQIESIKELSSEREEMFDLVNSPNFRDVNVGISLLQNEVIEKELISNDPEFTNATVDLVLERGLKHENYTVQCASVGFLGEILGSVNGNFQDVDIDVLYKSISAIEDIVTSDNGKYNRWVKHLAQIVYDGNKIIH